jgi:hypothetical protein
LEDGGVMVELENPIGLIKEFVNDLFHFFMELIKVCLPRLCVISIVV